MLQDLCSCASQSYSIQPSHQTDTGAHSNHWLESWITTTIFAAFRCNLLFTVPFAHMAALALRDQFVCLLFLFFLFFSNCTVEMWNSKMEKWNTGKEWNAKKTRLCCYTVRTWHHAPAFSNRVWLITSIFVSASASGENREHMQHN